MELPTILLRGVQLFLTVLITALIGNAIATAIGGNPPTINYAMFVAVFCWLLLAYTLLASFLTSLAIPIVILVGDALAVLFTFVAGVAIAAQLGAQNCANPDFVDFNVLTAGSWDPMKRCREVQASCAFFWFLFAVFCVSLAMNFMSSRGGMSMRKGAPSMSQIA